MGKYMKIGKKVFGNGDRHGIGPEYYSRFIRKKDVPKVEQKYVDPMGKSSSVLLVGYSGPMVKGVPVYDRRGNLLEVIDDDSEDTTSEDYTTRMYILPSGKYQLLYPHEAREKGAKLAPDADSNGNGDGHALPKEIWFIEKMYKSKFQQYAPRLPEKIIKVYKDGDEWKYEEFTKSRNDLFHWGPKRLWIRSFVEHDIAGIKETVEEELKLNVQKISGRMAEETLEQWRQEIAHDIEMDRRNDSRPIDPSTGHQPVSCALIPDEKGMYNHGLWMRAVNKWAIGIIADSFTAYNYSAKPEFTPTEWMMPLHWDKTQREAMIEFNKTVSRSFTDEEIANAEG